MSDKKEFKEITEEPVDVIVKNLTWSFAQGGEDIRAEGHDTDNPPRSWRREDEERRLIAHHQGGDERIDACVALFNERRRMYDGD